jgi:spore maturation protein SpmB
MAKKNPTTPEKRMDDFRLALDVISQWAIPTVILVFIVAAAIKRVPMYESFVTGAKEGFNIAVMIIPYLVAMLLVVKVFMASGLFDDIKLGLIVAMQSIGLGGYIESLDLLPLALTKPLTGSGARAVMVDMFEQHGPDSFLGMTASILMGSTETTFYILTVYYGAVQIKKIRHTLAACLWTDLVAIIAALTFGYTFYYGR